MPRGESVVVYRDDDDDTVAAREAFTNCAWFRIYDVVERIHSQLVFHDEELADPYNEEPRAYRLRDEINAYFRHAGIGWQIEGEEIVTRGDDAFEQTVRTAENELTTGSRPTAADRIKKAVQALSALPRPDTAGAISHATGAMECVLHDITGHGMALGDYLNRHRGLFPGSMQKALHGLWGFSSEEGARHGREGTEPSLEDAEFIVGVAAAVTTYLNRKNPRS